MHLLHAPPPSKLQPLHIDREQSREVVPTTAVIDKYTGEEVQKAEIKLYYPKDSATRIPKVGGWVGGWVGAGSEQGAGLPPAACLAGVFGSWFVSLSPTHKLLPACLPPAACLAGVFGSWFVSLSPTHKLLPACLPPSLPAGVLHF